MDFTATGLIPPLIRLIQDYAVELSIFIDGIGYDPRWDHWLSTSICNKTASKKWLATRIHQKAEYKDFRYKMDDENRAVLANNCKNLYLSYSLFRGPRVEVGLIVFRQIKGDTFDDHLIIAGGYITVKGRDKWGNQTIRRIPCRGVRCISLKSDGQPSGPVDENKYPRLMDEKNNVILNPFLFVTDDTLFLLSAVLDDSYRYPVYRCILDGEERGWKSCASFPSPSPAKKKF